MSDNDEIESWVDKYRPHSTWKAIQGNNTTLKKVKQWCRNWSPGDSPLLFVGDPGTGKTSTAEVVKNKMGWESLNVNASSARTTDDLRAIASLIQTSPPEAEYQLVLLDEIDSFHGSVNTSPLTKILDDPPNPVILTANDEYSVPQGIKRKADKHEFKLGKRSRKAKLKKVAEAEDVDISSKQIGKLATRPDLRSAINDLQVYAKSDGELGWDERNWDQSEFDAVDNILRGKKYVGDNISPPDMLFWLDENVSKSFRLLEQSVAYDLLSRADKWIGRAQDTQEYRYWKYAGELQEQVAEVRLSEPWSGYIKKDFPEWWRHSTPDPEDDSDEAKLFRQLSKFDEGTYRMSGSFPYFNRCLLPLLKDLDKEEKFELALHGRLDEESMRALGVKKSNFDDWRTEEWTEGYADQSSAIDW